MPSHRSLRMAEAIREVVSQAILFQVSDPRVQGVTVLNVEVASDLRSAIAFVSVMGKSPERESAMKGLRSATGFLQSLVAARLQTRFTPVLSFKRDEGIKKSVEMSKLIEDTLALDRIANPPRESDSEAVALTSADLPDDPSDHKKPDVDFDDEEESS